MRLTATGVMKPHPIPARDIPAPTHSGDSVDMTASTPHATVRIARPLRMTVPAPTRTDSDATVGYYAVGVDELLGEKHAIANPLMLHIAGADHFVLPEAQAAIHAGLDDHPRVTLHDYPGLDHGFAAEMGDRRNEEGAQLADSRTEAFLAEHLA